MEVVAAVVGSYDVNRCVGGTVGMSETEKIETNVRYLLVIVVCHILYYWK